MLTNQRYPTKSRKLLNIIVYATFFILTGVYIFLLQSYNDSLIAKIEASNLTLNNTIAAIQEKSLKEVIKNQPVYIELPGAKPIRAIVEDYTDDSSLWRLVNKDSAISTDYIPSPIDVVPVAVRSDKSTEEKSMRTDVFDNLASMFDDANKAGNQLMVGSAYRSAAQQSIYYNSAVKSVGLAAASRAVAVPGTSEHQTGLAVDISTISRNCYLDSCFATTNDGKWLENNSYKYGFVLRYPEGKESITGYKYEPWHFRYVGIDLATALYESGLTLDEAAPYLQAANDTLRLNGAI